MALERGDMVLRAERWHEMEKSMALRYEMVNGEEKCGFALMPELCKG
jgi:hypothetical protein